MSLYDMYKTDEVLEKQGVDLVFDDCVITIARAGGSNKKFKKTMERLAKPHRYAIQRDTISPELVDSLILEAYAEAVILGWENMKDYEGNLIPFSKENVMKVMTELPDLFEQIKEEATRISNYRSEEDEDDVKN